MDAAISERSQLERVFPSCRLSLSEWLLFCSEEWYRLCCGTDVHLASQKQEPGWEFALLQLQILVYAQKKRADERAGLWMPNSVQTRDQTSK